MARKTWSSTVLVLLGLLTAPAHAISIFETFDIDTADVTDGSYPDFTLNIGPGSVTGGALQLGCCNFIVQRFIRLGFAGDLTVSGQIQSATFGDWNVGIEFGNRRFVFHPGFSGGAFRIEDAAAASALTNNIDMGFTPDAYTFHTMQLSWNGALDELTIMVSDGKGVAAPFLFSWTPDAGFDSTAPIGFTYSNGGGDPGGIARFDNLTIVPEPSIGLLLGSGFALLAAARRRRPNRLQRVHAEASWRR